MYTGFRVHNIISIKASLFDNCVTFELIDRNKEVADIGMFFDRTAIPAERLERAVKAFNEAWNAEARVEQSTWQADPW